MAKEQVSSILRALQILECFMDGETEWTLKALVDHLDLPTTTVFRQVSTLTDRQYLIQDPVRKSYQVGPRLMLLASAILSQSYLDKVETHRSIVCNTRIGSRAPAYATSSGKVMLANKSEEEIDQFCQWMGTGAKALTESSILDPDRFRAELGAARVQGYAKDDGEIEEGLICYGAPIYDMNNRVAAAVSVSGPEYRMREEQELMIREVMQAGANISRLLGYRG